MKGLIINHNTQYIDKLVELFECDVMNHVDFDVDKVEQYDYVILSGGTNEFSTCVNCPATCVKHVVMCCQLGY